MITTGVTIFKSTSGEVQVVAVTDAVSDRRTDSEHWAIQKQLEARRLRTSPTKHGSLLGDDT